MCGGRWGRVEGRCPLFARKGELWEPAELLVDGPEPQVKRLVFEEGAVEMTDDLPLRDQITSVASLVAIASVNLSRGIDCDVAGSECDTLSVAQCDNV